MGETQAKKKKAPLSMWKVILIVIAVVYVMSFIIPSGAYERDGKMAIPGTYQIIDKIYLNLAQVILAVGDLVYSTIQESAANNGEQKNTRYIKSRKILRKR